MSNVAEFVDVTKLYGGVKAVDGLNLSIGEAQFVTLLGPSGCGKSTTLRMLGGFETPEHGRILLSGKDVTRVPPNRRNVNIVFQDYALFPHMNVRQNIAFGLELKGMESAAIDRRVRELLDMVELGPFAERMPTELSGGQRQRVALIRALAPDPDVLLLDEPLSALDAKLRHQMQVELKSIQKRTGKSFLFVTHDQEEALTMSDLVVVMNKGRIEQMGGPEDLYRNPQSRFVANFIGDTNLISGRVGGRLNDRISLDWGSRRLLARAGATPPAEGAQAEVAVRPEAITLSPSAPELDNAFQANVRERIFKGSHLLLSVALDDGVTLEVMADPASAARLDDGPIWIGWAAEDAVVLPKAAEA
ncbi:ABC transporter ATP-binding protein [Aureimonas altamirensis]|uniref:ABC transporter ATP-binding protein n=1 Tax=Aureimonas altamirensis TaxID=370622 RepID=UPI0030162F60